MARHLPNARVCIIALVDIRYDSFLYAIAGLSWPQLRWGSYYDRPGKGAGDAAACFFASMAFDDVEWRKKNPKEMSQKPRNTERERVCVCDVQEEVKRESVMHKRR